MHLGLIIGAFFAFVVLTLLSFLRNGAILRGGAVAVMRGGLKGQESSSEVALQPSRPSRHPLQAPAALQLSDVNDSPNCTLEEATLAAATTSAASPHSQSSQVFLQARRSAQVRKRNAALIRQRGGDAAAVAAAERDGVTASAGSDVASAWDPAQLCADDGIRLVFLFTFSLPVFAFWCWQLRSVRVPYLLQAYCWYTAVPAKSLGPGLQSFLSALPVFFPLGGWFVAFLYYAFFIYLNHRDKDVSLKRHNTTVLNRLVNCFKFCVYRRYVNFQCDLWRQYFSLQLIPAYGPLPLFLFPEPESEEEEAEGGGDNSNGRRSGQDSSGNYSGRTSAYRSEAHLAMNGSNTSSSNSGVGGGGGGGSPSRVFAAAATASARHNPFFVTVSSSSAGETSPVDTPLRVRTSSIDSPAFLSMHAAQAGDAGSAKRSGTEVPGGHAADSSGRDGGQQDSGDDWDEEERGLLRSRKDSVVTAKLTRPPSGDAAGLNNDSFSSADLTRVLHTTPASPSKTAQTAAPPPPPPPPAMRRAHYFFAAHPHGILPWCCCVNMISNVTKRNRKLFVDNREAVLHPEDDNNKGSDNAPPDASSAAAAEKKAADVSAVATDLAKTALTGVKKNGSPALSPRSANTFTTTNTRGVSSPCLPDAALFSSFHRDTSKNGNTSTIAASPLPAGESCSRERVATSHNAYAKGRYYVYHPSLKKFVLRLDKDEAVPASAADAAAYQQRLKAAEDKRLAKLKAEGRDGAASLPQRLKIRIRAVVATFPFYVPIMREIYMFYGYMDASYETCKRVLLYNNSTRREREGRAETDKQQQRQQQQRSFDAPRNFDDEEESDEEDTLPEDLNHLLLFPGGASEALLSSTHGPAKVLLRRRKGFLRLALHTQSGLVPVYTFGETDYFEQFSTTTTRYAAPLDDDSTLFSQSESTQERDSSTLQTTSNNAAARAGAAGYYRGVIASCTDDEEESEGGQSSLHRTGGSVASSSPVSSSPTLLVPPSAPPQPQQLSRRRELEKRLLRDEERALDREGRLPRSPAQAIPTAPVRPPEKLKSIPALTSRGEVQSSKNSTTTPARAGRLPRFIQSVQRLFQETFGISLPVVRNIIPHRVNAATVVGRPIYFELPLDLQRIYTDPANYYDREKERAVLLAAQEVYFNELQELFLKYAPRFLKDPGRRKLEIL